jgi:alpha-beta hydrolase superfamily lysophospholipase
VNYARENGARSVILFGWSMGGAIALQLSADPKLCDIVTGLLLESPILDWVATLKANCVRAGLPAWAGALAVPWLDSRPLARLVGLANPMDLRSFDWIDRSHDLALPTLILHGALDTSSPFKLSKQLQALRPEIVDLEPFDADHTLTWNSDRERWRAVLALWLASPAAAS